MQFFECYGSGTGIIDTLVAAHNANEAKDIALDTKYPNVKTKNPKEYHYFFSKLGAYPLDINEYPEPCYILGN